MTDPAKNASIDMLPAASQPPLQKIITSCPRWVRQIIAVFQFELQRTRTHSRMTAWLILAAFPIVLMALLRFNGADLPEQAVGAILYGLIPQVVCLLGLLLWVAPHLNAELEGGTWIYYSVRPGVKSALLVGKYLNGVYWTTTAAFVALAGCMLIGFPSVEPTRLFLTLSLVTFGASFGYGSIFAALGALFPRRAMMICVVYVLIFEMLMSNVPAIINKITVQHRLLNILLRMTDWDLPNEMAVLIDSGHVGMQVVALGCYVVINLLIAATVVHWREYATAEQNQ